MSDIKTIYKDDGKGGFSVRREQNTQGIIDLNKSDREIVNTNKDAMLNLAGRIPNLIYEQWMKEWGCTLGDMTSNPEIKSKIIKRLNSPEYSHLKIYNGKV